MRGITGLFLALFSIKDPFSSIEKRCSQIAAEASARLLQKLIKTLVLIRLLNAQKPFCFKAYSPFIRSAVDPKIQTRAQTSASMIITSGNPMRRSHISL